MIDPLEAFLFGLQNASDLDIAHLAKFRSIPPLDSGLDNATYERLFTKALADAYSALEQMPNASDCYSLLDRAAQALALRIQTSALLVESLQAGGAFAAEGSVRAYVLATVLRASAPDALSEFAAAILKIPVQTALSLEPLLEAPGL